MAIKEHEEYRVRRSPRVAWRRIEDEAVLVHLEKDFYITLDSVGTRIWELMGEFVAVPKLVEALQAEFEGSAKTIEKDLGAFLRQLQQQEMIERL